VINDFQIGCDPEFIMLDDKGTQVMPPWATPDGEVGYDHAGRVFELRPNPTQGTFALVRRLKRLIFAEKLEPLKNNKYRAGARAGRESLGGHVHFSFPLIEYTFLPIQGRDGLGQLSQGFVQTGFDSRFCLQAEAAIPALDKLTSVLEHLDILPKEESTNRRRGQYGKFGDVRDSNGHMEYRTMASWLYDPKVAYLCLTGAKLAAAAPDVALESLKGVTSFAGLEKWFEKFGSKDINARRALDKVFCKGLKGVQVSPDVNFRERWETLGL
jgi:hypothetical protein